MDGRGLDGGYGDPLTNNSSGREVHSVGGVFAVTNPTCSLNPLLLNVLIVVFDASPLHRHSLILLLRK